MNLQRPRFLSIPGLRLCRLRIPDAMPLANGIAVRCRIMSVRAEGAQQGCSCRGSPGAGTPQGWASPRRPSPDQGSVPSSGRATRHGTLRCPRGGDGGPHSPCEGAGGPPWHHRRLPELRPHPGLLVKGTLGCTHTSDFTGHQEVSMECK